MKKLSGNILIFTIKAGGGHLSLANAVYAILASHHLSHQTKIVNISPTGGELLYRYFSSAFPDSYASFWEWSNAKENIDTVTQFYTLLTKPIIDTTLASVKPKIIISTDSFSILPTQIYLRKHHLHIPHIVYVADPFSIHKSWAAKPNADLYLVANEETVEILHGMGVPKKRIVPTGWLLRKEYYLVKNNPQSQHKLNLFIGGSGDGGGGIHKIVKLLIKDRSISNSVSITVSCGKNQLLLPYIRLLLNEQKISHKILGYTPKILDYMNNSDLVIGKPGPNLLFESIMLGKPFISTGEPLAQEVGNYEYIDQAKIGYNTTNARITYEKILFLLQHPEIISKMKKQTERIRQYHTKAPERVWQAISQYL